MPKKTKIDNEPELKRVGRRGFTVTPIVREDRGHRIYFQWPSKRASGGYESVASDLEWPEGVQKQRRKCDEANERALRISDARRMGLDLVALRRCAMGEDAVSTPAPQSPKASIITVADVMLAAIGPSPLAAGLGPREMKRRRDFYRKNPPSQDGLYKTWTPQARMTRGLADQIEARLGKDTDFLTLTSNKLGRLVTAQVSDNPVKRFSAFLRVSQWAEAEYGVSRGYKRLLAPPGAWQQNIKEQTTLPEERVEDPERYSRPQAGRIWRVLSDPESPIHPQLRLAALIGGGEGRVGQMLKLRVTDCVSVGSALLVKAPSAGKKHTCWVIVPARLVPAMREAISKASRDGRIFSMVQRTAQIHWRRLERLAGVPEIGWLAMRRAMVDLCMKAMTDLARRGPDQGEPLPIVDPVVLDTISWHRSQGMRIGLYAHSPMLLKGAPLRLSTAFEILVSARMVSDHARRMAIDWADFPEGDGELSAAHD